MFTANPQSGDEGEILIEASYGLGEAVVSGLVQPDTNILDRDTGEMKSYRVGGRKWRFIGGRVRRRRCRRIGGGRGVCRWRIWGGFMRRLRVHEHFKSPQDTEWAIAEGKVFMLQSRAVTTLAAAKGTRRFSRKIGAICVRRKRRGVGTGRGIILGRRFRIPRR